MRLHGLACGPGAYMVGVPDSIDSQPQSSTFWKALPGGRGVFWPMFVIATLAAIVASQALISAARMPSHRPCPCPAADPPCGWQMQSCSTPHVLIHAGGTEHMRPCRGTPCRGRRVLRR